MFWILAGVMSIVTWMVMGLDKWKAIRKKQRIAEKSLFSLAIAGGATGGVLGMIMFRHKTQKKSFKILFPFLMGVQMLLLLFLEGPVQ
ncbi:DUF1294 domain-containing protein [Salimicrobium flavidum]|uniref:Uncharacterized membrane protein YsdA, DUF1294 family n=1 Tax=Salimicrobium flavidum TaxID=570947 RepID=A0A1N7JQ58_9BACI|nr:DUF1294 domain-containing protein [Salimicrobium flavidum]SIS51391.1 Uncharacterized membrane protein YsdA, DUF1294 family [Salimicrobium flavidum]